MLLLLMGFSLSMVLWKTLESSRERVSHPNRLAAEVGTGQG